MKKLIVLIFILLGYYGKAQSKVDSIRQIEVSKFIDSTKKTSSISALLEWGYKNMTAEKYVDLMQNINLFIDEKYRQSKKIK